MTDKIEISIITPSYNRAHTLERVFNSLKSQTFQNFEWIVIDDGSTDETREIVKDFIEKASFPIQYYKQENKHKFYSIFIGIKLAKGEYISLMDSDDKFLPDALGKLYNQMKQLPKNKKFYGVTGLLQYEDGTIVGEKFPQSPLDSFIFEMRYKYKVRGDKWGMGFKNVYNELQINLEDYENKGFIPESVYQYQFDALGYKTRFVNEVYGFYVNDTADAVSLGNNFYSEKNSFGLTENYKVFINSYKNRFLSYPKTYFKNFTAYLLFGIKDGRNLSELLKGISGTGLKIGMVLLYPLVKIFKNYMVKNN
ncbi:MAG: glycosyltransferase family 2 protein [Flavobacteriaceae bacterium]|jgi:glycosyltransferase involved in cell wall biosynthesis|nr:glycosyltransferase family 2 protein [Flavobacteriaceae bacterium]